MIFEGKDAGAITPDEMRRIVSDHVVEDRHLEYKSQPYLSNAHGTTELVKDVAAFLNADGGYIIIGIKEDGQRRAVDFASVTDAEAVRRSIVDRCLDKIDPRPPILDIAAHDVDGKTVLVIRVPESDRKPHCSRPDAEHHYFWRRYEDGNKLMTAAEIRECFQGDRVERELAELRREIASTRRDRVVEKELALNADHSVLLKLTTPEALLEQSRRCFLSEIGSRAFMRLFVCPDSPEQINLSASIADLRKLVAEPPSLRPHGWDLRPLTSPRVTASGVIAGSESLHNLRVLRNGYIEFRTSADDESFHWAQSGNPKPVTPNAIIEPAACLPLLAKEVYRLAEYRGGLRFGLELHNVTGVLLLPYAPDSVGYRRASYHIGSDGWPQPFPDAHLAVPPVTASVTELPDMVAWKLVSEVYYRFGYTDDREIPFFNDEHQCMLGAPPS